MLGWRKGILSFRGRPIARVEPIGDDPTTPYVIDNAMRTATRLYNKQVPREPRRYFNPETSIEDRYYHGAIAGIIALVVVGGVFSGSWAGFIAMSCVALALHWIQPAR